MRGLNRVIIAGNLTRDPELRYTASKKAYARFMLAVNSRYRDANGEYKDDADFITVVAWGNTAEISGKYLKKGSPVLIEGRIKTGSYDAKDGSGKRYTTEVWVDNMIMLGSGKQGGNYDLPAVGDDSMDDGNFGSSIIEKGFDSVSPDDTGADIPF